MDKSTLEERFGRAVQRGMLSQEGEHVLRMRHGIGVDLNAPLGIKRGLGRNPGVATAVMEMEHFLARRASELCGATPNNATEAFFGHGAHLGDDAEGEALRLATSGPPH